MAQIDRDDLDNRFAFHPARTPDRQAAHEQVRERCRNLADELLQLVPPGREASLVVTHLEEAMMWANAGIARQTGD